VCQTGLADIRESDERASDYAGFHNLLEQFLRQMAYRATSGSTSQFTQPDLSGWAGCAERAGASRSNGSCVSPSPLASVVPDAS
jgi:hypothetical protein